jgi:Transposase family tnp2
MSLGGAQVTKLQNYEVAPIIHINLNLPPYLRYRNENILLSCLIPGPKKHGLLDTLYPMVEEMKALHTDIPNIYNNATKTLLDLHAWIPFVSGDGPASAEAMGMAIPGNAVSPFYHCQIKATRGASNHYYVSH